MSIRPPYQEQKTMSEPLSNDPRDIQAAFSREQRSQDAQNAAANAASNKSYNARENQFNRPGLAQSGSFSQPGSSRKGK